MVDIRHAACYNQNAHFYAGYKLVADYLLEDALTSCNSV